MRNNKRNQRAADAFRIIDSLSSEEQLIIQCCAIIGTRFSRDMLLYVLSPRSPLDCALTLKKLFELKVLTCATIDTNKIIKTPESIKKLFDFKNSTCTRGDISDEKTLSPNDSKEIICNCCDNKIHGTCLNLPKNASCGYMKFCSTLVSDIIYLLSDNELKRDIHLRAVEYLEKQKANCRNCDYGHLHLILNPTVEQYSMDSSMCLEEIPLPSTSKQTTPIPIIPNSQDGMEEFKSIWGFRYISKLKNCDALIRDFSTEDSPDCKCLPILKAAYYQMAVYHSNVDKRLLNTSMVLDSMIQYANVLIKSSDPQVAIEILGDALEVLETTPRTDLAWQNKLVCGKIYTLLGYAYMELDQFEKAELYLRSALKEYRCEFTPDKLSSKFKALRLRLKQCFGLFILPNTLTKKKLSHWKSYISNSASEMLSHLARLFMKKNQWEYADFAATLSLSKALKTNNHFETLCMAYTCMLKVALHYKRTKISSAIEVYALHLCKMKTENMTKNELKAVVKLYTAICTFALSRGDVEKANQVTYIGLRIAESIKWNTNNK